MVLASTRENTSIEELAQFADRIIIEVAVSSSVSYVSIQPPELDQLKADHKPHTSI